MKKILIATTNLGKFQEIASELSDLPFTFLSLNELDKKIATPPEDEPTIEGNAVLKAKYYGKKTGLLTIADDGGLFIKALNNWPGVITARVAKNDTERKKIVLKKMKMKKNRTAIFKAVLAAYDPQNDNLFIASGETKGTILTKSVKKIKTGFAYDPIFYVTSAKKAYAEMTLPEKNKLSHRGKALIKIKLFLIKQHSFRQLLVSIAIIVKDRKMLMTLRRDHRPEFDKKWEFPGGGVDNGENLEQALRREVREETGYNIKILEKLPDPWTAISKKGDYQVFVFIYICKVTSGKFKTSDTETIDHGWFTVSQALKKNLMPLNKKSIQSKDTMKILKKYIKHK